VTELIKWVRRLAGRGARFSSEPSNRYLLGDMTPAEKERFEERYFGDDAAYSALCAAEEELIDSFLCGRLSRPCRRKFERIYLASPLRAAKVEEARQLMMAVLPVGVAKPFWRGAAEFFWSQSRLFRFCAASGCLVVLLAGSWLLDRTFRLQNQLRQAREVRASKQVERRGDAVGTEAGAATMAVLLTPGLAKGSQPLSRTSLGPNAEVLRVLLVVDSSTLYDRYCAALRTPEGDELWRQSSLRRRSFQGRAVVALLLPSDALIGSDFIIQLEGFVQGRGKFEPLSSYWLGLDTR